MPAVDWAFWMNDDNMSRAPEGFVKISVRIQPQDLLQSRRQGDALRMGSRGRSRISAVDTSGHTPGHTPSSSRRDRRSCSSRATSTCPTCSCATPLAGHVRPGAGEGRGDAPARLRLASTDQLLVSGYHFPFPGLGYMKKAGSGYRLVPAAWNPVIAPRIAGHDGSSSARSECAGSDVADW